METTRKKYLAYIIYASIMFGLPTLFGVIFSAVNNRWQILEIAYVSFGILSLLITVFRFRMRDRMNYKKNKTLYEDHSTDEYIKYRNFQWFTVFVSIMLFGASLIVFGLSL